MNSSMMDSHDRRFMRKAVDLALKGMGRASPNPTVGCVVVQQGRVLGEAWHEYALLDHAEVRALSRAGDRARGATVYVTLEPCSYYGRTGPCVNALIEAGVRRVVVAQIDPNPRVSGGGVERLRAAGIQVDLGLMQEKARQLIEPFACHVTNGRPLVVSKVGMSLDGRIATAQGTDRWITSPEAREFGQSLRLQADALLVGVGTVLADNPELTYRGKVPRARPLTRVILDSQLRTPPSARLFQTPAPAPVLIFCAGDAQAERRRELETKGAEIVALPRDANGLDVSGVLDELGKRNVLGVVVEGGSAVHWSFVSHELVDKFYFIVAPVILGGRKSVPSVGGEGYARIADAPRFKLSRPFTVGPDLVLETYPSYSRSIVSPWRR